MKVTFDTPSSVPEIADLELNFPLSVGDRINQLNGDSLPVSLIVREAYYIADTDSGQFYQSVSVAIAPEPNE